MKSVLEQLKKQRLVWSANEVIDQQETNQSVNLGYAELDAALDNQFPTQGVVSVDSPLGIGELRLLLPYLHNSQKHTPNRLVVIIDPPLAINSEMLAEQGFTLAQVLIIQPDSGQQGLWAAEQCLKSGCCNSVLIWQQRLQIHQVKRLQLAAKKGAALQVIFRKPQQQMSSLPVSLALTLASAPAGIQVTINKRKGGWPSQPFLLNTEKHWPRLSTKKAHQPTCLLPQRRVS